MKDKLPKIIITFCLIALLTTVALFNSKNIRPGYTTSLYSLYSDFFWLGIYILLAGGIILVVYGGVKSSKVWLYGAFFILISFVLLWAVPLANGYVLYGTDRADALIHLANVRSIIQKGRVWEYNWYPSLHVFGSIFVLITDVKINYLQPIFSFLFTMLYIIMMGVFIRTWVEIPRFSIITTAFATPLLFSQFHRIFQPAALSFLLLPTYMVVYSSACRRGKSQWFLLSLIFGSGLIIFHPMTSIYVIIISLVLLSVCNLMESHKITTSTSNKSKITPLIFSVILVAWIYRFRKTSSILISQFLGGTSSLPGGAQAPKDQIITKFIAAINGNEPGLITILERYILGVYLPMIIYVMLSIVFLYHIIKKRFILKNKLSLFLSVQLFVGGGISLIFLIGGFVVQNEIRAARYPLMFAVLISGFGFCHKYLKNDNKRMRISGFFIVILVVTAAVFSAGHLYQPNHKISEENLQGVKWHLENNNPSIVTKSMMVNKIQFYVQGIIEGSSQGVIFNERIPSRKLPKHLNYDNSSSATSLIPDRRKEVYVYTRLEDRRWYQHYRSEKAETLRFYTDKDIKKLNNDNSANLVYSNDHIKIFLVEEE